MTSRTSLRSRALLGLAIAATALIAAAPVAQAGSPKNTPKKYYLALGDSLGFGYQAYKVVPPFAASQFTTGYVDRLESQLKTIKPDIQTVNKSCPGATSGELNSTPGCTTYPFPLHDPYAPGNSQLQDAVAFINAQKAKVSPISINIGPNDLLRFINGTCGGLSNLECVANGAPAVFAQVAGNLGQSLAQLKAAAPDAKLLVLGTYNPFQAAPGGAAANPLLQQFNAVLASVAAGAGAEFADPYPAFNGASPQPQTICSLTLMCGDLIPPAGPDGDIHASDAGYAVLGDLLWDVSGYDDIEP
jgi:lysophospholipase L1-like esterase